MNIYMYACNTGKTVKVYIYINTHTYIYIYIRHYTK